MLVKYRPTNTFFSPLFEDFWHPFHVEEKSDRVPRADILERKDDYVIYIEMPGVDKDDIKVEIENNLLTISGKKDIHEKSNGEQYFRVERQCGNYWRNFRLGDEINHSKVSSKYENGVLKVVLPKAEKSKPKSVEVKVN